MEDLVNIVRHVLEKGSLQREVASLKEEIEAQQGQQLFQALHRSQLVGKSPKMLEVYRTIGTVATGDSTVLVTGESGTGKELVARAIHEASPRRDHPFMSINCGAFPETLLESELFGYLKGAFTGAAGNKKGLLEVAHQGSIFLDEIAEMTPAMQVKILRVLQERKLRPLGGTQEVEVDVRVIAATNRDLQAAMRQSAFREDLYYRLAVITIALPPLRERLEDIDLLAYHFLGRYAQKARKRIFGITEEALRRLQNHHWPGNVRELENTIERAVALETSQMIQADRLPDAVRRLPPEASRPSLVIPDGPVDLQGLLAEIEQALICQALERCDGNQTLAARELGLTRPSLRHRIQTLGIDAVSFRKTPAPVEM